MSAQLNPKDIYINGKQSEAVTIELSSQGFTGPSVVVFPSSYDSLGFAPLGGGLYEFTFVPVVDFRSDTKLTIQYYQATSIPGFNLPNYTTLHYRIEDSKLDCSEDFALIDSGTTIEVDVLANDSTTDDTLSVVRIAYTEGGTASIGNNKISFTPDASATSGYVRYFTSDTTSNIEASSLYLTYEDDQLVEDRILYLDQLSDINLYLNSLNYQVSQLPSSGALSQNGHIWTYVPNAGFTGIDNITFTSPNGGSISYTINVLNKMDNRSFVVDDKYFLATNGSIAFNVFDNDYLDNFNIIDYSSELTYLGNGDFQFDAPADFTGDLVYFYKIYAGFQFHTGDIIIHVDDFAPSDNYNYSFTILNNHDLVIQHEAPISDYYFNLSLAPQNGVVIVIDDTGSQTLACDVISGNHSVIYIPDTDFSGADQFDIEFCTTTGICETLGINVDVLSSNYTDCLCLSNCVYEGDINNDGVVNNKDALDLALNLGEGGLIRQNDFDLFWTGQESTDWDYYQLNSLKDLKSTDADGNGYIDYEDFIELEENYGKVHNFVPNEVGTLSIVPITFVPQSTELDSGEWLFIDIYAGNASQAALDMYGLALSFNINPDIMDSASVEFVLSEDSWLAYNSPLYDLTVVPTDGKVDLAVSRINNQSTDGIGIIGTLGFIVEDEFDGLKEQGLSGYVAQQITMNNIISVNEYGEFKKHPDQVAEINVAVENTIKEDFNLADQITIFPNPSSDFIKIQSERFSIDRVEIYDALGRAVALDKPYLDYQTDIDLSSLQQGIYFIRVHVNGKVFTEKVQKLDY